MNKLKNFVASCENNTVGLGLWIAVALSIIFLRNALESVIAVGSIPLVSPFHLVHVPLFFIALLLTIIVILHFFSATPILKVSRLVLCFFPIILLPVALDFIFVMLTGGKVSYGYIATDAARSLVNFFNPFFLSKIFPSA